MDLGYAEGKIILENQAGAMLQELRSSFYLLQADVLPPETRQPGLRPALRVIEGGLSKA